MKKLWIGILGVMMMLGMLGNTSVLWAQEGYGGLWTMSNGSLINAVTYQVAGWKATSYHRNSDGTAQMLWTNSTYGYGSIWSFNASGTFTGAVTYTVSAGWSATSYFRRADGYGYLIWTNPTYGYGSLWIFNPSGGFTGAITYTVSPGWTAESYFQQSDGAQFLLWTNSDSGYGSIWYFNSSGNFTGAVTYQVSAGWRATSYHRNSDYSVNLLWTNAASGYGSVWTFNNSGNFTGAVTYTVAAGWTAESFFGESTAAGKAMGAAELFVPSAVMIVQKSGSGRGKISAGDQMCDESCQELVLPYVEGEKANLTVTPENGSYFAGWQTADGVALENIYYANPGDTVYAIFNQQ